MSSDSVAFGAADLSNCDREPIHIPGSVQPHGGLLVVDRRGLKVEQTAGDTTLLLGIDADVLIGADLSTLFDAETYAFLIARLASPVVRMAPALRLGVSCGSGRPPLDLTLSADADTALLEVEPARRAPTHSGDPIEQLKQLLASLVDTSTVLECCTAAAAALRAATGFERAMVYRFMADESGVVVAEDREPELRPFLGLHYPASDIPQQARAMYLHNWLRAIPDVHYVPATLQPVQNPRTGGPIDMSDCSLRSVSPIHLEYLRNMGVAASLALSVVCDRRLWGMLILHHSTPRVVAADLRVACESFAQVFSLQIEARTALEQSALRIDARTIRESVVSRLANAADFGAELASRELLTYVNATGIAVFTAGRFHCFGFVPEEVDLALLMNWLDSVERPVFATDRLAEVYPDAAHYKDVVCGLLAIALNRTSREYVVWFRAEYESTVRWAGDPSKPVVVDKHGMRLTPRGSFEEWCVINRMHSKAWSAVDLEAADALRVVLLESVLKAVDRSLREREKSLRRQNLLLAELDHRVRNALGTIEALVVKAGATEGSVHSFSTTLRHRILAMTQTHTLLAEGKWVGTSLRNLLNADLAPLTSEQWQRIAISGEDLFLSPLEALALSMVLHEMMTNTLKHGALTVAQGAVSIHWGIDANSERIVLRWEETGGPELAGAKLPLIGMNLIARTIEDELHGTAEFDFAPAGLRCEIRLPTGDPALR